MGVLSFSSSGSTLRAHAAPLYITSFSRPRPWYRPHVSLRTYTLIALPLLSLLGAFGTWTLGGTNGTFKSIIELIAQPGAQLPGTNEDLVKIYTGMRSLDSQLSILVTFFAPLVGDTTRENGALHLFSIFASGQFGAVWCLMVMESLRIGNQSRKANLIGFGFIGIIGMIFQNISYTITAPLWLFIHLLTSPVSKPFPGTHASSVLLVPTWDLRVLPASITIGYLIPTILMGLPSPGIFEPETHQYLIAFWQAFPIWTVITHFALRSLFKLTADMFFSKDQVSRPPAHAGNQYIRSVKHVYRFVLGLCLVTHLPTLLISALPASIFPSSIPTLELLAKNTISSVYMPYVPVPLDYQVANLTEGVHTFLIWDLYVGSVAFLLWAVLLYRNATVEKTIVDPNTSLPIYRELLLGERSKGRSDWAKLGAKITIWCTVSGPVGALAVLLWERDIITRQKIKQGA